jgi:hypothetical protein
MSNTVNNCAAVPLGVSSCWADVCCISRGLSLNVPVMKTVTWILLHNTHSTRLSIRCHLMQRKWIIYWQHDVSENKTTGECTRKRNLSHVVFFIIIFIIILSSVSVVKFQNKSCVATRVFDVIFVWICNEFVLRNNTHIPNAVTETCTDAVAG